MTNPALTPDLVLHAYRLGVFPMAQSRDAVGVDWVQPRRRGIFPLTAFHISRSLARQILRGGYQVKVDHDFDAVLRACAGRETTWINAEIHNTFVQLHQRGIAHSVEIYTENGLIGGVYGLAMGGAFMGESMFSRATGGSKLALAHLVHRLRAGGFVLFDTQFLTAHLASLGAVEISQKDYLRRLNAALAVEADFSPLGYCPSPASVASSSAG